MRSVGLPSISIATDSFHLLVFLVYLLQGIIDGGLLRCVGVVLAGLGRIPRGVIQIAAAGGGGVGVVIGFFVGGFGSFVAAVREGAPHRFSHRVVMMMQDGAIARSIVDLSHSLFL